MTTVIDERRSIFLPTYTSLYFQIAHYDSTLFSTLIQYQGSHYDPNTREFEFPLNAMVYLVNLFIKYGDVSVKLFNHNKIELNTDIGVRFKKKPYQHQKDAVVYGLNRDNGWLLLDDQGLGKTATIIYLAEALAKKEGLKHCLIVCGVNSLKYNWENEISIFSNKSAIILGKKVSAKGKVSFATVADRCKQLKDGVKEFFIITNLETLQSKDFATSFAKSKDKIDLIVLDEAHKCKNPQGKAAKTLLKLKAKRCIALTGTMIMNVPENAYVPLKWTKNSSANFTSFKSLYNIYGGYGNKQVIGHKNLDLLEELISSCSLRRLKTDVLDLPPKTYIKECVELGKEQRKLYDEVAEGIISSMTELDIHKMTVMEEITLNMRLRQITAYPGIVSDLQESAKLDRLGELVETIVSQGDKAVIFSTFKETANEAYRRLGEYGAVLCTGDVDDSIVAENVKRFQSDKGIKLFIGTWQKCGTGITLTEASYVIFIDTPWTDADFQQASDRIYRIGQSKPVFIITLIAKDTYDERVEEILERKKSLSDSLIKSSNLVDKTQKV